LSAPALVAVLLVGIAFALGVVLRIDAISGPSYWHRRWHDLDLPRTFALLAIALPAVFAALREGAPDDASVRARLLLLMLASFALQVLGMLSDPDGFTRLQAIVLSPVATSYLTDALKITDPGTWLAGFHAARLELHSSTHPPGPILFYYGVREMVGEANTPIIGALAIGATSTLGVPVMWWFSRLWTNLREPRLLACALYALLPALAAFLPEFDQVYPLFAMLIVLGWVNALHGSRGHVALFAAALFGATMFAWNLLAIGVFVVLYSTYFLSRRHCARTALRTLAVTAALGLGGAVVGYLILWSMTGYDPLRSFIHALDEQAARALPDRPWLSCVVFDLYDFLLGSGMLMAPLFYLFLRHARSRLGCDATARALGWIGLATILLIDVSGLLRAETARVWLFLQPFLVVPAALALSGFGRHARLAVLALQWSIVAALIGRVAFIAP
jgi:hypothetical protein